MAITTTDLANLLSPYRTAPHWWLALSGGVDSVVLLHLLCELRRERPGAWPQLTALHIHHGLHPAADSWSDHCRELCAERDVAFVETRVAINADGGGIEAAARAARYAAFEQRVGPGELLLTAHHRDDQAETLLLRLLRGTGIGGAAAMPLSRPLGSGLLVRPLLGCRRAELEDYARRQRLLWIDDPSNSDIDYDRNFLRIEILPRLARRWPAASVQLARFAQHAREADELLRQLAAQDLAAARLAGTEDGELSIAALLALSPARRRLLLRFWLQQQNLPAPSEAQLEQVQVLLTAAQDSQPCVRWPGVELHRYRDVLVSLLLPPLPPAGLQIPFAPPGPQSFPGAGLLQAQAVVGGGLRADRSYQLRPRVGGERCRPVGRGHSQSLKKLLQEMAVPPWWRERLPLLWCGDELAAVADLWVCEGFVAAPGEKGWRLHWQRPAAVTGGAGSTLRVEGGGGF